MNKEEQEIYNLLSIPSSPAINEAGEAWLSIHTNMNNFLSRVTQDKEKKTALNCQKDKELEKQRTKRTLDWQSNSFATKRTPEPKLRHLPMIDTPTKEGQIFCNSSLDKSRQENSPLVVADCQQLSVDGPRVQQQQKFRCKSEFQKGRSKIQPTRVKRNVGLYPPKKYQKVIRNSHLLSNLLDCHEIQLAEDLFRARRNTRSTSYLQGTLHLRSKQSGACKKVDVIFGNRRRRSQLHNEKMPRNCSRPDNFPRHVLALASKIIKCRPKSKTDISNVRTPKLLLSGPNLKENSIGVDLLSPFSSRERRKTNFKLIALKPPPLKVSKLELIRN